MNKNRLHILLAGILLMVFAGGQLSLLTHHHELIKCCGRDADHTLKKGYHEKKPEIKCELCAAILHQNLFLHSIPRINYYPTVSNDCYTNPLIIYCNYKKYTYSRGPPSATTQMEYL